MVVSLGAILFFLGGSWLLFTTEVFRERLLAFRNCVLDRCLPPPPPPPRSLEGGEISMPELPKATLASKAKATIASRMPPARYAVDVRAGERPKKRGFQRACSMDDTGAEGAEEKDESDEEQDEENGAKAGVRPRAAAVEDEEDEEESKYTGWPVSTPRLRIEMDDPTGRPNVTAPVHDIMPDDMDDAAPTMHQPPAKTGGAAASSSAALVGAALERAAQGHAGSARARSMPTDDIDPLEVEDEFDTSRNARAAAKGRTKFVCHNFDIDL